MAISRASAASGRASSYAMGLSRFGTTCAAAFAHNSHSLGIELVQYSIHSRHSPLRGLSCRGHGIRLSLMPSMPASCTTSVTQLASFPACTDRRHCPDTLWVLSMAATCASHARLHSASPHPTPLLFSHVIVCGGGCLVIQMASENACGWGGWCVCVCVGASPAGSVKARGAHRFLSSSLLCHSLHAQTLLGGKLLALPLHPLVRPLPDTQTEHLNPRAPQSLLR